MYFHSNYIPGSRPSNALVVWLCRISVMVDICVCVCVLVRIGRLFRCVRIFALLCLSPKSPKKWKKEKCVWEKGGQLVWYVRVQSLDSGQGRARRNGDKGRLLLLLLSLSTIDVVALVASNQFAVSKKKKKKSSVCLQNGLAFEPRSISCAHYIFIGCRWFQFSVWLSVDLFCASFRQESNFDICLVELLSRALFTATKPETRSGTLENIVWHIAYLLGFFSLKQYEREPRIETKPILTSIPNWNEKIKQRQRKKWNICLKPFSQCSQPSKIS